MMWHYWSYIYSFCMFSLHSMLLPYFSSYNNKATSFDFSSGLFRKFLKSCRLNGCLYGKRNLAKSRRYSTYRPDLNMLYCWCMWPQGEMTHPLPLLCLSQCDVGEQCAVRKGARIGKMCDCPRGAFCNFFLLKCLWASPDMNVKSRWRGRKLSLDSFVFNVIFFYDGAEEQVRRTPDQISSIVQRVAQKKQSLWGWS